MKIIKYEDKYRDDMIFMILEAKNALGRVPGLNEDLLDIKRNYLDAGDMFWLAINFLPFLTKHFQYLVFSNCILQTNDAAKPHRCLL